MARQVRFVKLVELDIYRENYVPVYLCQAFIAGKLLSSKGKLFFLPFPFVTREKYVITALNRCRTNRLLIVQENLPGDKYWLLPDAAALHSLGLLLLLFPRRCSPAVLQHTHSHLSPTRLWCLYSSLAKSTLGICKERPQLFNWTVCLWFVPIKRAMTNLARWLASCCSSLASSPFQSSSSRSEPMDALLRPFNNIRPSCWPVSYCRLAQS